MPVYVDSPMALAALDVYRNAIDGHAEDVRTDLHGATARSGCRTSTRCSARRARRPSAGRGRRS
ncbi:MAG: hypothetical protein R2713_23805 [Ilumatobacteraceae bacterium]